MLMVHGFPDFWFGWREQLKEFSKDYFAVAIDQRGFGESDKPQQLSDYNVDEMVEDIHQLVKKLGRDKFILVGHDWGALIGWTYVKKHVDTLEKYIMIGGENEENNKIMKI